MPMKFDAQLDESKPDFSKERKLPLPDGQVITMQREDPYGLIRVLYSKGKAPDVFRETMYTSFREAERAVFQYLSSKGIVPLNA